MGCSALLCSALLCSALLCSPLLRHCLSTAAALLELDGNVRANGNGPVQLLSQVGAALFSFPLKEVPTFPELPSSPGVGVQEVAPPLSLSSFSSDKVLQPF